MTTLAYLHNGLATGSNDGTSQANAYQSMADALSGVAADTIVLSYDGGSGETLGSVPTASTDAGGNNTIRFVGVNSSFALEAGVRYTLDADSSEANAFNMGGKYGYQFDNFVFTNATSHCVENGTVYNSRFFNCIFSNAGASGINMTAARSNSFVLCQFLNNTQRGILCTSVNLSIYMCLFEGNPFGGAQSSDYVFAVDCISANNGTGFYAADGGMVVGSVLYGNTNGITALTSYQSMLTAHNIYMDNTLAFNCTQVITDYKNAWRGNSTKFYQAVTQSKYPYGEADLDLGSDPFDDAASDDWTTTQPNANLIGLENIIDANNSVFKSIGIEPTRSSGGGALIDGDLIE